MRRRLVALATMLVLLCCLCATALASQEEARGSREGALRPLVAERLPGFVDHEEPTAREAVREPRISDMHGNELPENFQFYRENVYTDFGKGVYDQIYAGLISAQTEISIPLASRLTEDELETYMYAVRYDHPEIFWMENRYRYAVSWMGYVSRIEPVYNDLGRNLVSSTEALERRASEILSYASQFSRDVDKVKAVHDWIAENTVYDLSAQYDQTAYSMFVNGRTVCAGYATAFQYLLQKLGIRAAFLAGTGKREAHAWNLLELDGEYYCMDVTWDDLDDPSGQQPCSYEYFNVTDAFLSYDHTRDELSSRLPQAYGTRYSYESYFGPISTPPPVPTPSQPVAPDSDPDGILPEGVHIRSGSPVRFGTTDDGTRILTGYDVSQGVSPEEIAAQFVFDAGAGAQARVLDKLLRPVDGALGSARTGDWLEIRDSQGNTLLQVCIVVRGDLLGTGQLTLSQMVRMAGAYSRRDPASGAVLAACDLTGSGDPVRLADIVAMAKMLKDQATS